MGADKALLDVGGRTLLEHVAAEMGAVCSPVAIVGGSARLPGISLIADDIESLGPAGGILTALRRGSDWNLIVAVDMPSVTRRLFAEILSVAESTVSDCVLPVSRDGRLHPLCAAYHRRCLPVWEEAAAEGLRKVREIILRIPVVKMHPDSEELLRNVNTPAEWQDFLTHAAG